MAARTWTCRRCSTKHPRRRQKCACGAKRPAPRRAAHLAVLDRPYSEWVAEYGGRCGICGVEPKPGRKLHRDHEHAGDGRARGLLCFRCNAALRTYMTADWLRRALAYLERS